MSSWDQLPDYVVRRVSKKAKEELINCYIGKIKNDETIEKLVYLSKDEHQDRDTWKPLHNEYISI